MEVGRRRNGTINTIQNAIRPAGAPGESDTATQEGYLIVRQIGAKVQHMALEREAWRSGYLTESK